MPFLAVESLTVKSPPLERPVVEDLCFGVSRGASLGIVGASGAGKTLTALALCGLVPEPLQAVGRMSLGARTIDLSDRKGFRGVRGRDIFIVFQSSALALDPTMRVGNQLAETLIFVRGLCRRAAADRVRELLSMVGLKEEAAHAWPFQLSGGMRQRIQMATAMALEPEVLIADEPTSGLDPVLQHQILGLIEDLRARTGTSLIIISHDLRVIARMAESVCIIKEGRMVEQGPTAEVFGLPASPFTRSLLEPVLKQEHFE